MHHIRLRLLRDILLIIALSCAAGLSQDSQYQQLIATLVSEGFENVALYVGPRNVVLTYENRVYRQEARAIKHIARLAGPLLAGKERLTLVPQSRHVPLVAVNLPLAALRAFVRDEMPLAIFATQISVTLDLAPSWQELSGIGNQNSTRWKFDLIVHPQVHAIFGNFEDVFETQINLAPEIRASLWPGMQFSAQVIAPLQNDLGSDGDDVRPGIVALSQAFRLPAATFAAVTAGYFTRNRYGGDLELRTFLLDGRLGVGGNLGYTGFARYAAGTIRYSKSRRLTAFGYADYRLPQFDLRWRAGYGRFLSDDNGWRFELIRQLGERDIGFFYLQTSAGHNAGFRFTVPLWPARYMQPASLRVRPGSSFSWQYRWESDNEAAKSYETGMEITAFFKRLDPVHLKNQLEVSDGWH